MQRGRERDRELERDPVLFFFSWKSSLCNNAFRRQADAVILIPESTPNLNKRRNANVGLTSQAQVISHKFFFKNVLHSLKCG